MCSRHYYNVWIKHQPYLQKEISTTRSCGFIEMGLLLSVIPPKLLHESLHRPPPQKEHVLLHCDLSFL